MITEITEFQKSACEKAFAAYLRGLNALPEVASHNRQLSPDAVRAQAFGSIPYGPETQAGGWTLLTVCGGLTFASPPKDGNGNAVPWIEA